MRTLPVLALLALTGAACAQPLYGVAFTGQFYLINTSTGAASLIGATGFNRLNAAAMNIAGEVYVSRTGTGAGDTHKLIKVNPATGVGTLVTDWGTTNDMRGLAFGEGDVLYGIKEDPVSDQLVKIQLPGGFVTIIGPTGRLDLQGLTAAPGGAMYAVGAPLGQLFSINRNTGAATLIGGALGDDSQAIEYASGNTAWAGRANLLSVNLLTGASTVIGPMGISDLRGMAGYRPVPVCYANCDGIGGLTGNDFQCFLNAYVAGSSYANCDGVGGLTGNDFQCFLDKFVAGCS